MKDVFNKRQRFSLRKYSVGVCSVLLGTALFAAGAQSASADEATAASESAGTAASEAAQPATTESSQTEAPTASKVYGEGASVPKIDLSGTTAATSETPALATEKAEVAETPAATENKEAKAESKKEEKAETKKSEEASKPLNVGSLPKITLPVTNKAELSAKPASTTAPTTASTTSTRAATSESSESVATSEAAQVTPATFSATVNPAAPITGTKPAEQSDPTATDRSATLDRAATDLTNAGALATSRSRRSRRALTDHNVTPIDVVTTIATDVKANPGMTDPNGASVHSQTIPAGYQAKEGM